MKKKYIAPDIEYLEFTIEDIVMTSGNPKVLGEQMENVGYAVTIQRIKDLTL